MRIATPQGVGSLCPTMIVAPKIRGFICTTAHPDGCAKHVSEQIAVVRNRGPIATGPRKVLVIGSSTGYGLSSRIAVVCKRLIHSPSTGRT
jgi:trans-2-enoyl-CoA reductase